MSRIILAKYPNTDEQHIVVGWDRPCASYYWQEFAKEPDPHPETGEVDWDAHEDWEEMIAYKGYMPNELPTMQSFIDSLPPNILELVTDDVRKLLQEHSQRTDTSSIVVDLTTSNVVMESWKVEVKTFGSSNWSTNAVRFPTEAEAKEAGADLARRWLMVEEWRVARSFDKVNYKWENGKAVSV